MLLYVMTLLSGVLGAQSPETAENEAARERGWELYQKAREAFRGGGEASPVHDYSFHLMTQVHTPQGVAQVTSATIFVYPNFVRQEIETPKGKAVVVFDGDHGWHQNAAGRRELPDAAAAQIRAELARNCILIGPEPDRALVRHAGQAKVEGRSAEVVQVADVGGTLLRLFVDTETHDVLKYMFVGDTPQGLAQVEEVFSDFRANGVYRWYHHRKVLRNGELALESTRSNLRVNVGYDKAELLAGGPQP